VRPDSVHDVAPESHDIACHLLTAPCCPPPGCSPSRSCTHRPRRTYASAAATTSRTAATPAVHEVACVALASGASYGAPSMANTIEEVIATIGSSKFVAQACMVLANHADASRASQDAIAAAGGVDGVTAAMGVHQQDPAVQLWACVALQSIAHQNYHTKAKIAASSGVEAVMAAMDTFTDDPGVQLAACGLLLSLSAEKSICAQIKAAGAADKVQRARAAADAAKQTHIVTHALQLRIA